MARMLRTVILLAGIFIAQSASAGNWYVWKGASGSNNGTSWTNAWTEMNQINFSTVSCGDTIWLGAGTYTSSLQFSKTCTSSSVLNIESVLSTDSLPTSAPGYTSAVLGQVIMNGGQIVINSGAYITINGRQGTIGTEGTFGILVECSSNCDAVTVAESGSVANATFTYVELFGPPCVTSGGNGEGSCTGDTHGVDHGSAATTNLLLDHMWMHRFSEVIRPYQWTNYTVQYSDIDTTRQTPDEHEDFVYAANPSSGTMRYNVWWGSPNDGIFFDMGGNSLTFYGNVVFHSGGAVITFKTGYSNGAVVMYNNTFSSDETFGDYQCPGNCPWIDWTGTPSSSIVENNIFDHVAWSGAPKTANYNAFSSDIGKRDSGANSFTYTSAFGSSNTQFVSVNTTNPIASNYGLTAAGSSLFTGVGVNLGAPYNADMNGNIQPATGGWTLGPYLFSGSQSQAPQPPTGLSATIQQ